jgi:hypothetical protein
MTNKRITLIAQQQRGYVKDLYSLLSPKSVHELALAGYLGLGVAPGDQQTWHATKMAKRAYETTEKKLSLGDHINNFYSYYILGLRVNLH